MVLAIEGKRRWCLLLLALVVAQTLSPRGAYRGRALPTDCLCPPKRKLCPPKRGLCPEEINRLGASGAQIEVQISVFVYEDLFFFFFGDHLFSAGKTAWICDFGRKIPLTFCFSSCLFHPDWDKFLVPLCRSRIHTNKPLVPPKIYFCPPSHAILAPGLWWQHQWSVLVKDTMRRHLNRKRDQAAK